MMSRKGKKQSFCDGRKTWGGGEKEEKSGGVIFLLPFALPSPERGKEKSGEGKKKRKRGGGRKRGADRFFLISPHFLTLFSGY